jgi:hypothetical protein
MTDDAIPIRHEDSHNVMKDPQEDDTAALGTSYQGVEQIFSREKCFRDSDVTPVQHSPARPAFRRLAIESRSRRAHGTGMRGHITALVF